MARGPGNITDKVDRDLLHDYLWKKADHNGRIPFTQDKLATDLGINKYTMSTIFREMYDTGRLRKNGSKTFVVDPAIWRWEQPGPGTPTLWDS